MRRYWITYLLLGVLTTYSSISLALGDERSLKRSSNTEQNADRYALVIGNSNYKVGRLKNPANDAKDIASLLERQGFQVTVKTDVTQRSMATAIRQFGNKLRSNNGVGLFYFAGHGIQVEGKNYLVPVDALIETHSDIEFETVDAGRVLGKMEDAGNPLNIVILDACRNNPFTKKFRSSNKGLARMDAPKGTLVAYSTAPGTLAYDGDGRNSVFTKHFLNHAQEPGQTIESVLKRVRVDVIQETNERQIPWESSSLTGDFYFVKNSTASLASPPTIAPATPAEPQTFTLNPQTPSLPSPTVEKPKSKTEPKTTPFVLDESLLEKDGNGTQVAILHRDERFIVYNNGTAVDSKTGLMWATKDNGKDINWKNAQQYCQSFTAGGYTDWRLPTVEELKTLYNKDFGKNHHPDFIDLTSCCAWSEASKGKKAANFGFEFGDVEWYSTYSDNDTRALPVRNVATPFKTQLSQANRPEGQ